MIGLKRVCEKAANRILVERLWPRGVSKEKASIDLWMKEIGPSTELRNGITMMLKNGRNSKNVILRN